MKNLIILGCGRSGTSMVAGLFRDAGYYMGAKLIPADESNPRGYYQSERVVFINERLLEAVDHSDARKVVRRVMGESTVPAATRWLLALEPDRAIGSTPELRRRMRDVLAREPYCFKDPRFSYTLRAWRPELRDPRFICVVRHPLEVAQSVLRHSERRGYRESLGLDRERVLRVWRCCYRYILSRHVRDRERWKFVHYDQILERRRMEELARFAGAEVDAAFVDRDLRRAETEGTMDRETAELYGTLCGRADYEVPVR